MFALLALIACFDQPAPVAAGPALGFVEMPCSYADSLDPDAPEHVLPEGAVVVSAMQCSTDGAGDEFCAQARGWFWIERSSGLVGVCNLDYGAEDTVVVNYLE